MGTSVDVAANEGVEIPLGKPPGDTFTVQRDQIDYSTWNSDKLAAMLADPLTAMTSIETAMASYIKDVNDFDASFKEYSQKLADERANAVKITDEKGKDAGQKYQSDVVFPLMNQTAALSLNLRYSTLAALSLRRFVTGRLYVALKAKYIAEPGSDAWTSFLARYHELLGSFEASIAPHLVEADI
jgi:hypothetical protein